MRKSLLTALLWIGAMSISIAQSKTGSVAGTITTTDGHPAADVTIVIKNTNRGAVTASDGSYEIRRLLPGNYQLEVSLIGFAPLTKPLQVSHGKNEVVNFQLQASASELNQVIIRSGRSRYTEQIPSPTLRIQTPLKDLPQNIQTVTAKTISDQQVFDMSEGVTRNVSGAAAGINESWGNYANLIVRGGSMTAFRNGMNVKQAWGPLVEDMSMVERIEFVKGPAGFMLANGEPTGFYNIVTKKPTGVTRGTVGFSLGSFDTYRTTLDLDGKLSDDGKLLYRLNLMGQMKNSHRDYDYNNRYTLAPVVSYKFNEQTSLTAEYTYQHMKLPMLGAAYLFSLKMGDLPRDMSLLEPNLEPTTIDDHNVYLTLHHQLAANWKFTTQFAYLNYQQTGSSIWPEYPAGLQSNGDLTRSIANWDAFSEARLGQVYLNGDFNTGPLRHRVLGGVDMSYKDYYADFYQFSSITGFDAFGSPVTFNIYNPIHGMVPAGALPKFDRSLPLRQRGGGTLGERSSSIYVQDEIGIANGRVRLTLAGRHTHLKQHSFGSQSKDNAFTPRVGVSVSLDRSTSVYGLYDKTFVAQQGVDSASKPFVPVTGNSIEAGIKKDWFSSRWNSTLSVYRITRNNVITLVPGPWYKPVQTGQTQTRGVELDVRGQITNGLSLIFNYAFTEAEVTKDEDPAKRGGDVPGPGFPKHISNSWLSYRVPAGKISGFGASLGYQYLGGRQHQMADYFRMDGNLFWEKNQVRVTVHANNLLNRYLYAGAPYEYNNDFSSSEYYFQVEPGINFRIGVSVGW